MSKLTTWKCDRPGCGKEIYVECKPIFVTIREPPIGNLSDYPMDLCDDCRYELRSMRIDADLAFGDKLRPKESAREVLRRLGGTMPTPEEQVRNLAHNLGDRAPPKEPK